MSTLTTKSIPNLRLIIGGGETTEIITLDGATIVEQAGLNHLTGWVYDLVIRQEAMEGQIETLHTHLEELTLEHEHRLDDHERNFAGFSRHLKSIDHRLDTLTSTARQILKGRNRWHRI